MKTITTQIIENIQDLVDAFKKADGSRLAIGVKGLRIESNRDDNLMRLDPAMAGLGPVALLNRVLAHLGIPVAAPKGKAQGPAAGAPDHPAASPAAGRAAPASEAKKERFLEALRAGATKVQAAEAAGISHATPYVWAESDPAFGDAIVQIIQARK